MSYILPFLSISYAWLIDKKPKWFTMIYWNNSSEKSAKYHNKTNFWTISISTFSVFRICFYSCKLKCIIHRNNLTYLYIYDLKLRKKVLNHIRAVSVWIAVYLCDKFAASLLTAWTCHKSAANYRSSCPRWGSSRFPVRFRSLANGVARSLSAE